MKETQEKKIRIVKMMQKEYSKNKQENGITLIALVVTIVVMLILAGITIQTAIGDGGIINLANEAKEQQIIASYKDRIGIVGVNWSLNRALDDSVTVDDLWQDMQDAKIINNKETDVEKVDENGNYIITVPEGYKFQIHINEYDDLEIDYIGKEDNLLPYINEIKVINQTSNSVELQVSVSRLNNGTLNYYYKEKDAPDEDYQLVKGDTTDLTAIITGLNNKTTYEIKVEATNKNGTMEKVTEVFIGELKGTITQKGETVWSNGTATIHLETEAQNLSILYQINSIEGTYQPYDDTKGITGLGHGDTVFAVLSDGTNITDYTSIDVLDKLGPTVTVTQGSKSTNNIQVSVSSSDAEWGMPDSITYNYYIKKTADGNYPQDPTHTGTETSYIFTGLIQNTSYDVKVTTSDKAGNPGEGQATNITTDTVGGADDDLKDGNIIASDPTWSNGSASITLSKGTGVASHLTIQYQVGDIAEGNWTTVQAGANSVTVTGLTHNSIVYARLTDGSNYGHYASVTILDQTNPQNAMINLSTNTTKENERITATVTHTDNESGINITNCKWVYSTTSTPIGTEEGSYTGGNFSSNGQTINLTTSTAGTYYLHVLTVDMGGNKIESISNAVTVEKGSIPIEDITTIQKDNTKAEDKYGNIVTVPKGFKVVTTEATTVPEGIVIEDVSGNQFVWIPVGTVYKNVEKTESSTIILGRYTFDETNGTPTLQQAAFEEDNPTDSNQTYVDEVPIMGYNDNHHIELIESRPGTVDDSDHLNDLNATAKNLEEFVQSVEVEGGYYLARYEASYGSGYDSTGSTDEEKYADAKPLSKVSIANSTSSMTYDTPGKLWNFITQINASVVSQNMYANDNSVGVESDLTNSYAWDTAIVFIQEMKNSNYANANSDTIGNYTLKNTGKTGDKVCNIFDMAANVTEWTTEYSTYTNSDASNPCTFRGSAYSMTDGYTSIRDSSDVTTSHEGVGFRVVLYIK